MSQQELIGRWELVRYELRRPGDEPIHPFGEDPAGVLSYAADARMSVLFMRRDRPRLPGDDYLAASAEAKAAAFDGFAGYAGTWAYDEAARVVVHRIEVAWLPNWVGSEQRRNVDLVGDRLTLSSDKGWSSSSLVWRRAG